MSGTPIAPEVLERARECAKRARTVEEFIQAQTVVLTYELGWSLSQVADLFGIPVDRVRRLRASFIQEGWVGARSATKAQRRKMNLEEEAAFLAPFFESASAGTPEVASIRQAMEKTLGRSVSLSTVYNLLHRHGWGNLAPHMRHRKADGTPRED